MKQLFTIIALASFTTVNIKGLDIPKSHITLNAKILSLCDGVPFMLDGLALNNMLHVRKLAMHLITDAERYTFNGEQYSVEQLAAYEKKHGVTPELKELLSTIIEDFIQISEPFMNQARGTKQFMTQLITEWVDKRDRKHSLLLNWHKAPDGTEFDAFRADVTTFTKLVEFSVDMVLFMQDLMYNCPRGFEQLLEMKKKH